MAMIGTANTEDNARYTLGKDNVTGIRYMSFGSGERTMVVVPGLSLGYVTDTADAVADSFAPYTDEYTIYLFDIREDVPEGYTFSQMSEDLVTAINGLGLHDIYMYGCSMGGMQVQYIASHYPDLVEKVAVASSACSANETSAVVIGGWIDAARERKTHELTSDMGQRIYSAAVYEASRAAFDSMADELTDEILDRFANTAGAVVDIDIRSEASSIKCPILVMGSKGDRVLTGEASEEIAELSGAELYLYGEEYPHAVYDEAPDFKDRVVEFFK